MSSPPNAKRIKTTVSNATASDSHIQQLSPTLMNSTAVESLPMSVPAGAARTNPRKRRSSPPPVQAPVTIMAAPPNLSVAPAEPELNAVPTQVSPDAETPKKKGRTNTPWTPQEEQRLKTLRDGGSSWSEIAKAFPNRTEGSVKKHWYKDMHYAEFAEDESKALRDAIKEYDANKWKVIGQKVGKPAKACEQYAKEHFKDL